MQLCEADGKALLAKYRIPVPQGVVLDEDSPNSELPSTPQVIKAQVLAGGRGRRGLVSVGHANPGDAIAEICSILKADRHLPVVLLEEQLHVAEEYYIALRVDDVHQTIELLFSRHGGMSVEEERDHLARFLLDPRHRPHAHQLVAFFRGAGVAGNTLGRLAALTVELHRMMVQEDADLIEINPLIITPEGRPIAADAKISLDQSAHFRHPQRNFSLSERLRTAGLTPLEREAEALGCSCVELGGEIALVTAGAGLGMLLMDLLSDAGLTPASFFDNTATSRSDSTEARLRLAFEMAQRPSVSAIVFCQVLSTRDLGLRVGTLLKFLEEVPPPKPLYIALSAYGVAERSMTSKQARQSVRERGYTVEELPEDLVARMVEGRKRGVF